ncbi:hypothetical protein [Agromyces bauzanensis]|uniref:Uncharacterized protein n=1 Tax=Agromyces bauzanensis TaxID=1308924 RepID=A0A917PPW6_9MICO|nr:hypothetical protein [Agromyces bauzanensis]GGJ87690.1 hypothetical protein GCM10011372_27770 [Agromyces bauzanensis]
MAEDMRREDARPTAQNAVRAAAPGAGPAAHSPGHLGVLRASDPSAVRPDHDLVALARLAGNASVARLVDRSLLRLQRDDAGAAQPTAAPSPPKPRHTWVFIMGADPPGSKNPFFTHAETFYQARYGSVANAHIVSVTTLEAVLSTVTADGNPIDLLLIVSHGHPDGRLMFDLGVTPDAPPHTRLPMSKTNGTPTQYDTTKDAAEQGKLTTVPAEVIDDQTKIVIKGCNIGRSTRMVGVLKDVFGGRAAVTGSTHAQEFGGGREHLAEYYVEKPGTQSLTRKALAAEFKTKYSAHVPNMDAKAWTRVAATASKSLDAVPFEAYRGSIAEATDADFKLVFATQLAELAQTEGATSITFIKRVRNGADFDYTFGYKKLVDGSAQAVESVISIEAPPDDAAAIQAARDASGRPASFDFSVRRSKDGLDTVVTVTATRTEWKLVHQVIKDGSGTPIPPPPDTDVFWYTTVTPPPAPATTP